MSRKSLFFITSALIAISIIASYTLTTYTILFFKYNEFHFFIRQLIFGIVAIFIMWGISKLDPDKWRVKIGLTLFFTSFFLMFILNFLPSSIAPTIGGAKRWIKLGFISLAPVEFFKVGFIFFLAWSFSRKFNKDQPKKLWLEIKLIAPHLFIFIVSAFFIAIFQNDIGQVMVLGLTLSFLLILAGRSFKLFLSLISFAMVAFVFFVTISAHRIARIKMWWASAQKYLLSYFPDWIASELKVDASKESYQIIHSLNAFHHGGIIGQGIGNGEFKLGFLSEAHTDFVLAGLSEEMGFLGLSILMGLYIFLLHRLFKIANQSQEKTAYLFTTGVAMLIAFSLLINSYGVSSIIPIKGIAVPLLSYGGSSILATSIAIGMVMMLSKKRKENE